MDNKIKKRLEAALYPITSKFNGIIGISVEDVDTCTRYGINENIKFPTASVIKVPIMAEVYRQVESGRIRMSERISLADKDKQSGSGLLQDMKSGLRPTVGDLVTLMMIISDNTATNMLLNKIGVANVNKLLSGTGIKNMKLRRILRSDDPGAHESKEEKTYGLGYTTPLAMLKLLKMMYNGELVSRKACDEMLEIMLNQRINTAIPRFLSDNGIRVAHKTGSVNKVRNDAGIVYHRNGAFIFSAFTKDIADNSWNSENEAILTIGRAAEACYKVLT